jgi:hypothetical protein
LQHYSSRHWSLIPQHTLTTTTLITTLMTTLMTTELITTLMTTELMTTLILIMTMVTTHGIHLNLPIFAYSELVRLRAYMQ